MIEQLSGNIWLAGLRYAAGARYCFRTGTGLTPQPLHEQDDNFHEAFCQKKHNDEKQEMGEHFGTPG
jgi:hypothetical protein